MRIVVFADGTWNKMDMMDKGTNVVKLCQATVDDRSRGQIKFYDAGVGTRWYNRLRGGAFGVGISQNIKDCYSFIIENWRSHDDEIFLFGFSRGAYTARSLSGLITFAGILRDPGDRRDRAELIDRAYDFYRDAKVIAPKTEEQKKKFDPRRKADFEAFIQKHGRDLDRRAKIKFIGVWDTVGALGIPQNWLNEHLNPFPHEFHDTSLGRNVEKAYHAISIDEKRKAFRPTLWDDDPRVQQVFFTGVHSDIGGGYKDDRRLGDISLTWMAEHAVQNGLDLDKTQIPALTGQEYCGVQHESWTAAWRVVRRFDREIRDGSRIHGSVRKRLEETQKKFNPFPYAPKRLTKPWERFGWM